MNTRSITSLLAPTILLASTTLAGGGQTVGTITNTDPTWNRPNPTGTMPDGNCNTPAADSLNDSVHYDVYYIRANIDATFFDAAIDSLEPTPIDFDPMAAVYCGVLDPNQPLTNLIDIDDDSNGYPNALIFAEAVVDTTQVYTLVVSSYSNHPQSQFGDYLITLAPGFYFSTACQPDYNGDGQLDFFDISAFLTLVSNNDLTADINVDGFIDFFDVSAFLAAFANGCP
ncbi:MAG: hypothetical protein JJ974_00610 [Phycisphaerales bacterium]|nr:hypothetical protein [Phycisphaerales bacterium]